MLCYSLELPEFILRQSQNVQNVLFGGPRGELLLVEVTHVFYKNMFTFEKQKQDPLFYIDGKPVYAVFKKDESRRIHPFRDSGSYLGSNEFLEKYNLSRKEGAELKRALGRDQVPETPQLKTKFYHIRRDLNERLYTEIDLRGTNKEIEWRFPEDHKAWPTTQIIIGSSGVGKTHKIVQEILEAMKRKRKKRKFLYVSPELTEDATLKKVLNNKRYEKYFSGLDISDDAFEEWRTERDNTGTVEDWWEQEIHKTLKEVEPSTFVVLDDAPDSPVHRMIRPWLVKMLRTGRHKKIGVGSIQHNIRGGRWTSQSYSSVKWVTLFPRGGGKGLQVEFLAEQHGVPRKKARELIEIFGEGGRWMMIHQWSPPVLFGPKFALFL